MNVLIRPLERNDAYTSFKWRNTPDIWSHTKFKPTKEITIVDELAWIENVTKDSTSKRFAIIAGDEYVGNIYLTDIHESSHAEYHIFIGNRDYWGRGVARAASALILDYGKNELNLERVLLAVHENNTGAYHLYSSLGFKETGEKDEKFIQMFLDLAEWNGDPRVTIK